MKVETVISEDLISNLIKGVMENYPEASMSLACTDWNYEKCEFTFFDEEADEEEYKIDYDKLRKGFEILINVSLGKVEGKNFYASGWEPNDVFKTSEEDWDDWACDWDACVVDGLVQCAIFGEVIYG